MITDQQPQQQQQFNPLVQAGIPDAVRQGKFLLQSTTGRWYCFSQQLAQASNMLLYVDGVQVENPYLNGNRSLNQLQNKDDLRSIDPALANSLKQENAALKQQNAELSNQYNQLASEVQQLKMLFEQQSNPTLPSIGS